MRCHSVHARKRTCASRWMDHGRTTVSCIDNGTKRALPFLQIAEKIGRAGSSSSSFFPSSWRPRSFGPSATSTSLAHTVLGQKHYFHIINVQLQIFVKNGVPLSSPRGFAAPQRRNGTLKIPSFDPSAQSRNQKEPGPKSKIAKRKTQNSKLKGASLWTLRFGSHHRRRDPHSMELQWSDQYYPLSLLLEHQGAPPSPFDAGVVVVAEQAILTGFVEERVFMQR